MKMDSLTANIPKNMLQYLLGFALYILVYHSFNPVKLAIGLVSFLVTYSAIYPYNDLMDYKEDRKDKFKKAYKALARGDMSHEEAITLVFGLPIIGMILASFVSSWYMVLLAVLLLLNFLYSAPQIRLKKRMKYAIPSMLLMQLIKFSLGWFTFTTNVTRMPGWVIITFSFGYIFGYVLYKKSLLNMKKSFLENKKILVPISIITLFSFFVSLIIYPYKIPLLLIVPIVALISLFKNQKDKTVKSFKLMGFSIMLLSAITILFLSLNIPAVANVNKNASDAFGHLASLAFNKSNNETKVVIRTFNETLYSYPIHDLNEFNIINFSNIVLNVSRP